MNHPKTFTYNGKTYDWWPMHPDNYTWEDGTQSCTPLQAQIERIKFTDKQMDVLISAMSEYQNLWRYGDDEGVRLGIVNEDGSLAGILGDIDSKIEEVM